MAPRICLEILDNVSTSDVNDFAVSSSSDVNSVKRAVLFAIECEADSCSTADEAISVIFSLASRICCLGSMLELQRLKQKVRTSVCV